MLHKNKACLKALAVTLSETVAATLIAVSAASLEHLGLPGQLFGLAVVTGRDDCLGWDLGAVGHEHVVDEPAIAVGHPVTRYPTTGCPCLPGWI